MKDNIKSKKRIDEYGEVMTPERLVEEMLDSLPSEIWKDRNKKWIDNSCGSGNFLFAVMNRLSQFHDKKYILENMIWGVDIQEDNVEETKKRLGGGNIIQADALTFDYWEGKKFEVVVGNPPYNKEKKGKKGNNCNPLWDIFVSFIVDSILEDNGYLCLVHPPLWRKPEHKLWYKLRNYQFEKIKIFSMKESSDIFGVATKVDYYVMRKSKADKETEIIGENNKTHKIQVFDKDFIPNKYFDGVYKIFSGKTDIIYSCAYHHYTQKHMSKEKDEIYKFPCIYLANKKGITYYYSSVNNKGHFGQSKIIVPLGSFQPILDFEGEYGMCEVCFGIPIKSLEHGEKIMKLFRNEKFLKLLEACKWKTVQFDYRLFKYFWDLS